MTDRFEYDTYGKLTGRTGSSDIIFLYNGRDGVVTDGNGLIYMRARYYAPELRRFINADILAGDIASGITLNRYAYANGNPVSMIDPKGLSAERGNKKYVPTGSEPPWLKDDNSIDIEYIKKLFDEVNVVNAEPAAAAILEETLAQIIDYLQSYSTSGKYSMTAIIGPNITLSFEFGVTGGDGDINIASISLDQIQLLDSMSYELFDNVSVSVGKDGIGAEFTHNIDDDTAVSASITGSMPRSFSIAYGVTQDLGSDISASTQIAVTYTGNSDYSGKSSKNEDNLTESSQAMDKNNDTVAWKALRIIGAGLLLAGTLILPTVGEEAFGVAALGAALA